MAMRAAIYARISRDDHTNTGLGVARQEEDCREFAAARGWDVAEVFVDNDVSAYSGRVRPAYRRMLEAAKDGAVEVIVAWHPNRLHRSPLELEEFIDLVEASGVLVATVRAGDLDLASASGRMVARVVGAMARHESEEKSERLRRKALELARAGKVGGGGTRPYGFEADRVTVRAAEAAVIREASERVLAGDSMRSITTWMNTAGHLSPTGGDWSTNTVLRMLTSPRVAGLRQHRGDVIGEAVWPAILDRVTWERVRRILLDPARRAAPGPGRRYLLTGVLFCALCGKRLVARPKADGRKCVVCASGVNFGGCGKIRQLAEPLDRLIAQAIVNRADDPDVAVHASAVPTADHLALADELATVERRLAEVGVEWAEGRIDATMARAASERLTARLEALRRRLDASRPTAVARWAGKGVALREVWGDLHIDQQRSIVADYIDRIELGPLEPGRSTQVFWPGRVRITWR